VDSSMNTSDRSVGMVSTVITCYNKGPYLAEAIESALRQDYAPHEVIVVDDGSTDDSRVIAESFGNRIRLIKQENRGASGAKNRGILEATGEFIAFLDGDDRWRDGKLQKQLPLFKDNPRLGVVYTDEIKFYGNDHYIAVPDRKRSNRQFHRGMILDHILVKDFVPFSSIVARRAFLIDVGLLNEDQRISDDYELLLRLAKFYEFDYVDEIFVEYRTATNGLSESGAHILLELVLEIQHRFIATHFEGKYPNPAVVRRATASKYEAHGEHMLANGKHVEAIRAYLVALKEDPRNLHRYYKVIRAMLPNHLVRLLKRILTK